MLRAKVVAKIKTNALCFIPFFQKGAVYEVMWKNAAESYRLQMTLCAEYLRLRRYTYTHSVFVMLFAFPRQQWLRERVSVLFYAYIACIVANMFLYVWDS